MKEPKLKTDGVITPTDFKRKSEKIIKELKATVFNLTEEDCEETCSTASGSTYKKKKQTRKNEIKPTLTPTMVNCKLDQLFIRFMPLTDEQLQTIEPDEFLQAYDYFMDIMLVVNSYILLTPTKPLFCGFVGISEYDYNNFLNDLVYERVFKFIDSRIVGCSQASAESGLVNSTAINTRLQTKDVGHGLVKNGEAIVFNQQNNLSIKEITSDLTRLEEIAGIAKKLKNSK